MEGINHGPTELPLRYRVPLAPEEFMYQMNRSVWDKGEHRGPQVPLREQSAGRVRFTFTGTRQCRSKDDCINIIKSIQREDNDNGREDIRYNFFVGSNGMVYEGRGWAFKHEDSNYPCPTGGCIDVAFIGNFRFGVQIPFIMHSGGLNIIKGGLQSNKLRQDFSISFYTPSFVKQQRQSKYKRRSWKDHLREGQVWANLERTRKEQAVKNTDNVDDNDYSGYDYDESQ